MMDTQTEPKIRSRRLRRLVISPEIAMQMMTTGWDGIGMRCIEGAPVGSILHHIDYDIISDCLMMIIEHESFDSAPEGQWIPVLIPQFSSEVAVISLLTWIGADGGYYPLLAKLGEQSLTKEVEESKQTIADEPFYVDCRVDVVNILKDKNV